VNATGAIVQHADARAYYDLISDKIYMPQKSPFPRNKTQHRNRELLFNFAA
jgi:antirestriction protein ArdC